MLVMTTLGLLPVECYHIEPRSLRVMLTACSPRGGHIHVRGAREYLIEDDSDFLVAPIFFREPIAAFKKATELRTEAGLRNEDDPMNEEDIWDCGFMVRLCFSNILDVANGTTRVIVRNLHLMDLFVEQLRRADSSIDIIPELTEGLGTSLSSLSHVLDLCDPDSPIFKSKRRTYVDPMGNLPPVSPDSPEEMIINNLGLHKASVPASIWRKGRDEARCWWMHLPFLEKRRRCIEGPQPGDVDSGEFEAMELWFSRLGEEKRLAIVRDAYDREMSRPDYGEDAESALMEAVL